MKVMESFIKNSISSYMYNNNFFLPNQHGFTARKSCASQLLHVMNYWTQCLDNKYPVDVVYLDFHKAFDMVLRKYLLMVMVSRAACSLGLKLFNWKEAVSCLKWSLV